MGQLALFGPFTRPSRGAHQVAVDGWHALWREARGSDFAWNGRHAKAIKEALKLAGGDPEVLLERARRLLFDPPSAWYAQNASPSLLASKWNELGVTVRALTRDQKNAHALLRCALEL